jgi:hypothetical protein
VTRPLLNKSIMYCNYKEGKKMLCIKSMLVAQKLMWVKRCLIDSNQAWCKFFDFYTKIYGGTKVLLYCKYDVKK